MQKRDKVPPPGTLFQRENCTVLSRQIHFFSCLNCAMNYTDEVFQLNQKNIVQLCINLLSELHHLKQYVTNMAIT